MGKVEIMVRAKDLNELGIKYALIFDKEGFVVWKESSFDTDLLYARLEHLFYFVSDVMRERGIFFFEVDGGRYVVFPMAKDLYFLGRLEDGITYSQVKFFRDDIVLSLFEFLENAS